MWGMLDTGYAVRCSLKMFMQRLQWKRQAKSNIGLIHKSVTTAQETILRLTACRRDGKRLRRSSFAEAPAIDVRKTLTLFHRLFEAHIIPAHLVSILATLASYDATNAGGGVHLILRTTLALCSACRAFGFMTMVAFIYRYNGYHQLCAALHAEDGERSDPTHTAIVDDHELEVKALRIGPWEAVVFPIGGVIFGALPALQATVMHIWTAHLHYSVSLKPLTVQRKDKNSDLLELGMMEMS